MKLTLASATDAGLKRSGNEDFLGCWVPETAAERERRGALLVIADGMGGARAGEVASRLAVEAVLRVYRDATSEPLEALRDALLAANRTVHAESVQHPERDGMGTTCTAAVVRGAEGWLAHVGDSRIYRIHAGRIDQLTHDHSLVAQLVREHHITADQARTDPRRNVVTRSVGIGAQVEVDAEPFPAPLAAGDTLLLCTDGLHGLVTDAELARLGSGPDLERACGEMIELTRRRGAPDNVTVILARLGD